MASEGSDRDSLKGKEFAPPMLGLIALNLIFESARSRCGEELAAIGEEGLSWSIMRPPRSPAVFARWRKRTPER